MSGRAWVVAPLLAAFAAAGLVWWWALPPPARPGAAKLLALLDQPATSAGERVAFIVHEGESATSVAQRLQEEGLLRSALVFVGWAVTLELDQRVEAGQFELSRGLTARQLLEELRRAQTPYRAVTLVEGWRIEQVADALASEGVVSRAAFLAAARSRGPTWPVDGSAATMEGYLFPDTYFFPLAPTEPAEVIQRLVATFLERFPADLQREATAQGLTLHELVTLASIVEREARLPEERPHVASVLLNRWRIGMKLEADPTVQYALAQQLEGEAAFGYWKADLTLDDLEVNSPYNTYRMAGLPPSPIANPGLEALLAVLRPIPTNDLFFVARPDGSHAFAANLEEHLRNIRRYRP